MLTKSQLALCKDAEIALCDKNTLTDLRDITVDKSKSVMERIENFTGQVKNPYLFKVGDNDVLNASGAFECVLHI